ncbi:MAG: tRNA threonylcarbamoyladenosine dehydratase [Acidaminococcaceae bacterium]|nr:tRNA threonylcarbamoyladenosine dehydratase [Acidaminococcaceae bacterium]
MENQFSRTERLLGKENMEKLAAARVCIFGIGGVGGYVAEALARSGVGHLELVDNDVVCLSNLNRQIIATHQTLGQYKVDAMKERILSINPEAEVVTHRCFYLPETQAQFDFTAFDYVVDAIDTVAGKISLVLQAEASGTPIISSMGAGNKLDPAAFQVADIYQTSVCPLAKVMRKELKKRGVKKLKVVYSKELPLSPRSEETEATGIYCDTAETDAVAWENPETRPGDEYLSGSETEKTLLSRRRSIPGSVAFVPSVAGLIIAGEVVKDLLGIN